MATAQTQIQCPIWSFVDSMVTMGGNTIKNFLFDDDGDDDSRQIRHYEEKSAMTTNQTLTSRPIGSTIDPLGTVPVKGINKHFPDFENVLRKIQYYVENLKVIIFYMVDSLSYPCKIFVIKTLDFICLIIYVDNTNDNYDTNNIKSNNIYTNSDDNSRNNDNNNDYDDNCGDNNIDKNYDIYDTNNSKLYRTDTKTSNSTISNESECVENIPNNISYASESTNTTITNFDPSSTENIVSVPLSTNEFHPLLPISQFKSFVSNVNTQEDIDDELCLPFSYQYMFDKRTSPWEMKDWDHEKLNTFAIEPEKINRLYHMVADDEDQNFRSWEICCRMDYNGEKYFVEMYANCDYTGFDCQGGGHISITKLPDFFLENMVTMDQNPDQIYKSLREDGYNVQEPDLLHKVHPKFWNSAPMLKYLCHNAIYKHRDALPHFKDELPKILANSIDDFIKVKDWENE